MNYDDAGNLMHDHPPAFMGMPVIPVVTITKTCRATMGFAAAWDKEPGDLVAVAGLAHTIMAVDRKHKNAPVYTLDDGSVRSWQTCGDVN